jgi:hypothetical protein
MKDSEIYTITLNKWSQYNQKAKKSYKATLIQHSLITDAKVNALTLSNKWLFINILLICGDHANDTITLTKRQINDILTTREGASNALDRLQSLQLVTYEKTSLIEVKEKNRKERNRKEKNRNKDHDEIKIQKNIEPKKQDLVENATPHLDDEPIGKFLVGVYCNLWKDRYKSSPPLRPQDTKQLKTIGEGNGREKTKKLFEAYFKMPDPYFVKRRHDLQTFLNNLTSIAAFAESNRVVTNSELRTMDSFVTNSNTAQALREGKI